MFPVERPLLTILLILSVIAFFLFSAQNLEFGSADYADSFPPWDVIYRQYELYYKDFGYAPENVYILLKSENVLDKNVLEYMLSLQNVLENKDGVVSTSSPASIVRDVFGHIPDNEWLVERTASKLAKSLLPERNFALISVQIESMENDRLMELSEEIERTLHYVTPPPGVVVEVTGGAVLMYQIAKAVEEDVYWTFFVASVIMLVVLVAVFSGVVRSKLTVLFPLIISLMSVAVMVGLLPLLGLRMTEYNSATVPILIGLAIDYAAQLQNRYEEERRGGKAVDEALLHAIKHTRSPLFMAMATTVIGFASMLAPGIPSLFWFSFLLSVGLITAFLLSNFFLPALLKITDRGGKEESISPGILERILTAIARVTIANSKKILALTLILIIFGAYATTQVQLETNRRKYAPPDLPALVKFEEIERKVSPQYVYVLVFSAERIDAETIAKAEEVAEYISAREEVYGYDSLGKTIEDYYGVIPSGEEFSEAVESLPREIYSRFISGNHLAVYFYTNTQTEEEVEKMMRNLEDDLRFMEWRGEYYITGFPVILGHLSEVLFSSLNLMTLVAYFLIVVFLLLAYRSIVRAIIPLISISVAVASMNICMLVLGIKQTTISIALNSIVLGMGIDYSIHITERYFEERVRFGVEESVRRTVERTGKAVLTSALTTAGGFGTLYFSTFPVLSNFGILAFIAIIYSLLAATSAVPAMLILYEKTTSGKS
jgi:hydrophobe/amphiphile efflux-3 (HAE3) family protein